MYAKHRARSIPRKVLSLASLLGLGACDMLPAEVLDSPRILAIRADPPALSAGQTLTLEALLFKVDGPLQWWACPVAWAPTDPLSCPSGEPVALGTGNPLNTTFTDVPGGEMWIRVEGAGALPATRLLKTGTTIVNPVVTSLATDTGAPLPATIAPEAVLAIAPVLGPETPPDTAITSWYVTGGTLEPARTTGTAQATLTAPVELPDEPLTIIAVTRNTDGGTTWVTRNIEVAR
jgi:hypothetical protein